MREMGLRGYTWSREAKTLIPAAVADWEQDLVKRDVTAVRPNWLWVADLAYIATWAGFMYVALVIDVFSRKIGDWRVSRSLRSDLALDALEQALHARGDTMGLLHHSDRGMQYVSIRYTERPTKAGSNPQSATRATATTML